mmetsp:Transcript_7159/g.21305  ORF Transcript_7159/g.21305 Transcript_7159/m.21305 type:complete len:457 (-) Transcript_7159:72-1442(-)|eukprot:CAMPEP_0113548338 /NCGR_PEP_ID=MMETSP0015_2-20120614/12839_1 /TAXON_ID=2838 /ORGANISM="Odontella" /LENGTH=456 /DNA_ID=CAMNT_0000448959 /DNA_START=201 /DNA_END=1571 /DNA_ORIENTATION=- /assembly_acc=CAM_ASM_000160
MRASGGLALSWLFLGNIGIASGFQLLPVAPASKRRQLSRGKGYLLSTLVDISEDAPRDTVTVREWAAHFGVQTSDGFQLVTGEDGRDIFAITTQNLPADSPILYAPKEMILTGSGARQELGADAFDAEQRLNRLLTASKASGPDRIPQFYLFLKLLKEYENGDQSPLYPWLNSLPRYYSNGASMTDFCFGCLPPYAGELALTEKTRLSQFIMALSEVPFLSSETIKNADLAKWAFAVVHTRYLNMPNGDIGLIPMADYFNHNGAETEAYATYDAEGNFYAYSTRDVPAGHPLRICYADPTNQSHLLARYGFLDESCPATFCKIIVHNPSPELIDMGYDHSKMLFYKDTGEISQEVWDVLLYQELGSRNREHQQAFYDAHVAGDFATKQQYHQHYLPQTLKTLLKHVDYLLIELEELSQNSWRKDVERHPRLPLIMRHNDLVRNIFERVGETLDGMM